MTTIDQLPAKMAERIQLEPHPFVGLSPYCWVWMAGRTTAGYGVVRLDNTPKAQYVHRVAYTLLIGPIPEGLQIDHLCRVRSCCNPAHLEPVTPRVNTLRGEKAQKTHCIRNHPLSGDNLIWTSHGEGRPKTRKCRLCENQWQRNCLRRNRDQINARRRARYAAQLGASA